MAKLGMPSVNIAFIEAALKPLSAASVALWLFCSKNRRIPSQNC